MASKDCQYGYQQEVRKVIRFYPWAFMARVPTAAVVLAASAIRSMMKSPYSTSSRRQQQLRLAHLSPLKQCGPRPLLQNDLRH